MVCSRAWAPPWLPGEVPHPTLPGHTCHGLVHSISSFLVLLQSANAMGMPAVVTLTWPCVWHLAMRVEVCAMHVSTTQLGTAVSSANPSSTEIPRKIPVPFIPANRSPPIPPLAPPILLLCGDLT